MDRVSISDTDSSFVSPKVAKQLESVAQKHITNQKPKGMVS